MTPVCAITGASGYVGSRLAETLSRDFTVVPITRSGENGISFDLAAPRDLTADLRARGVSILVHTAWDMTQVKAHPYRRINVEGSRRLLVAARAAGVRQIVFLSTISAFPAARSLYGRGKVEVEDLVLAMNGAVIRPGLVWGDRPGGMFGALRTRIASAATIPIVGDGSYPQYLIHEDDLGAVVLRAAQGEFPGRTLTIANPQPWPLRELISHVAAQQNRSIRFLRLPWRLIYSGLKTAEMIGLRLNFRSDSVISLVHQNPHPDFAATLPVRPFS